MFTLIALVRFVIDCVLPEGTPVDTCIDRSTNGKCHLKISCRWFLHYRANVSSVRLKPTDILLSPVSYLKCLMS
jgi:hypothetical protein